MIVSDGSTIINGDTLYSVQSQLITGSVVFRDTQSQSSDHSLLLMLNPQANYSLTYYAASIQFVDDYLQDLHLNDSNVIHIVALASDTEVRIAPSKDIGINEMTLYHGEEYILTMNIGDTLTVSSSQDLTGSRVTSNKAVSLFSGHQCEPEQDNNCSVLIQQIPPFNAWGSDFIVHTNISYDNGILGNWVKIIASDVGANVTLNCTTDGISYESSGYSLDFREQTMLSIMYRHCAITSDENILILQFQDTNRHLADTFMLTVPGLVHYETRYVFNTFDDLSFSVVTIPTENPNFNPILLNNSVNLLDWKTIELNTKIYYYAVLPLPAGAHTLSFFGNYVNFGVIIYGNTHALPAGVRLNLTTNLPSQGYNIEIIFMIPYIKFSYSSFSSSRYYVDITRCNS